MEKSHMTPDMWLLSINRGHKSHWKDDRCQISKLQERNDLPPCTKYYPAVLCGEQEVLKKKILADSRVCHRIQTARSGGGLLPASAKCFSPKYIQRND